MTTLCGLPFFLIPIVGPAAGGGAIGAGIAEMIGHFITTDADFEVLRDKLPLLQFGIAASNLEVAVNQLTYLLEHQDFRTPMRYLAVESGAKKVEFLLEPVISKGSRRRPKVSLKPVPLPPSVS